MPLGVNGCDTNVGVRMHFHQSVFRMESTE